MKYLKSHSRVRWLIGAALLLLAFLAPLGVGATQQAAPSAPEHYGREYGSWRYTIGRVAAHGRLDGTVSYDIATAEGVLAFARANRALAEQLAGVGGSAEVQVTFGVPLTPEAFRAWAQGVGLTVQEADIRTYDAQGAPSTIGIFVRGDDPLPLDVLERQRAAVSAKGGPLTVGGVTNARGTVDTARLRAIAADPTVFLVDVTTTAVRRDLRDRGVADAPSAIIVTQPAYWQVETFGLGGVR